MMKRRAFLKGCFAVGAAGLLSGCTAFTKQSVRQQPNIIFIMADDMGYGDLGCYGQKRIKTPNIDQMAREGVRFTQCYAGCTVCAPSRSVLMTGQHMGHTRVRGNMCIKGGRVGNKRGKKIRRMNLASKHPDLAAELRKKVSAWKAELPKKVERTGKYKHQY